MAELRTDESYLLRIRMVALDPHMDTETKLSLVSELLKERAGGPDYIKGDRGDPGLGVNCCLCLNVKGERNPAAVVIDGYSFCEEHGDAVTEQRGGIMFYPDGRFSFSGTVKRMTQRRAELGAT